MKNNFKILDSDMHLMEPVDLWERYIDAKYKADAPRGLTSDNVRDLRMAHPDGRYWGLPASHNRNSSHHRGHNFRKNQNIYRSHAERGWTAGVQLEAMDIEGIDVAVLYPTRGLQVLSEPEWNRSSPPLSRAPITIGFTIFVKPIRSGFSAPACYRLRHR